MSGATERVSVATERVSGASERANGRASGPVLTFLFLFVPDHSAGLAPFLTFPATGLSDLHLYNFLQVRKSGSPETVQHIGYMCRESERTHF